MKSCKVIPFSVPLRDVRLQASVSPAEAEQDRRELEQAAYERGLRDGEKALSEQLMAQRTELLELHQGGIESLRGVVPQLVQASEKSLVELALEAAQKLVGGMPIKPNLIEAVVREALGQVEDNAEITVQLNGEDLALLRRHHSPVLEGLPETGPLRFLSSPDVTRGGCIVHTRFGLLDARRETKIEQLRQSLAA